jgi:hypothetical protein
MCKSRGDELPLLYRSFLKKLYWYSLFIRFWLVKNIGKCASLIGMIQELPVMADLSASGEYFLALGGFPSEDLEWDPAHGFELRSSLV